MSVSLPQYISVSLILFIGLHSILLGNGVHIVDRTLVEDAEEFKQCSSETKSNKSGESGSLKTHFSSASTGTTSMQSNNDIMSCPNIIGDDFTTKYYKELKNSLKNCILTKKPNVTYNDVAGNNYAKQIIREAFVIPNLLPDYFNGKPKPWNKILLYGPPGVGKTMLAKAVCNEINATVFWVSLADVTSKFIGESEKLLRMLFEIARERKPSIIVIDEMDSIGRKRNGSESETERRIKTEFLRQMDEINSGEDQVYVLATTNMPWELDIAALRRFERRILLPMPDKNVREQIFRYHIGNHPNDFVEEDYKKFASMTEGYSGADISTVVNDAMMKPVRTLDEHQYFKIIKTDDETANNELVNYEALDNFDSDEFDDDLTKINNFVEKYAPCDEQEEGAIRMSLSDISTKQLVLRKVNTVDFKESINNCKPTVHNSFLELYNKFLLKYGHIEQKGDLSKEQQSFKSYFL